MDKGAGSQEGRRSSNGLVVVGEHVIFEEWGKLHVHQLSDGKLIQEVLLPADSVAAGVAVAGGVVYVSCQDGSVLAFQ